MRLKNLVTEQRNSASENLDRMSAFELAELMNREDSMVPCAIKKVLPQIARAIDLIADSMRKGGRLIYVGTGTSGRIGALDASECPSTFGIEQDRVQFLMAGGEMAVIHASEASEDSRELGRRDMATKSPGKWDVVAGMAASGRTPYTVSALQFAVSKGASTIGISSNHGSELGKIVDICIEVDVGPEVLTGSSRLKAGTAQKLICNMLSTGSMARLGYVYSNLMVNLHLKNEKLVERGIAILQSLTQVDRALARKTLAKADMSIPLALVMLKTGTGKAEAERRLRDADGNVRRAIGA